MSEVAIPQLMPNLSSPTAVVSAPDSFCNDQLSLSQPQFQLQPQIPAPQPSRKRSSSNRLYSDETENANCDREIETQGSNGVAPSMDPITQKVTDHDEGIVTGQNNAWPHLVSVTAANTSTQPAVERPGLQTDNATPAKKRKITPQEKEEKRLEKEERERERAEARVRKEEERRKREEEKRSREEDRRKKAEEKEEERRVKEEERRKKEEEKEERKKEKEAERTMLEEEKRKKERVGLTLLLSRLSSPNLRC